MLADDFIERGGIPRSAFEKPVGKSARLVRGLGALPEFQFQFGGILLAHVPLKEHLHRKFAGFGAERHVTCAAVARKEEPVFPPGRTTCAKAAPFRWRPSLLRSPCFRLLALRDQWPARGCRKLARRR